MSLLRPNSTLSVSQVSSLTTIQRYVAATPGAMLVPEAVCADHNAEYLEIKAVQLLFPVG